MQEDKWLKFVEDKENLLSPLELIKKTKRYSVISKCSNCELGIVHWYPSWRHYTFQPTIEFKTEHSDRCMISIGEFIMRLNKEKKEVNVNSSKN